VLYFVLEFCWDEFKGIFRFNLKMRDSIILLIV